MLSYIWVGLGAAIVGLLRFQFSGMVACHIPETSPWGMPLRLAVFWPFSGMGLALPARSNSSRPAVSAALTEISVEGIPDEFCAPSEANISNTKSI